MLGAKKVGTRFQLLGFVGGAAFPSEWFAGNGVDKSVDMFTRG